jgi:hypothetical protein
MPTNYERAFADRPEVYAAWEHEAVRDALVVGRPIADE